MTINFPGPYQLRLYYDSDPATWPVVKHVMQFNIDCDAPPDVGAAFADIDIVRRIGTPVDLATVTEGVSAVLAAVMSDADQEITYAELWKYAPGTMQASYVATYGVDEVGTFASAGHPAGVGIYVFRTSEGGVAKLYLLEGPFPGTAQQGYSDLSAGDQALVNYMVADATSFFLGRDTSFLTVFLRKSPGQHETVFKKRFRQ